MQYSMCPIFVLILSQVDINTRLDPDGIWMPKHRLCCAAYRMSGAFVACFRNLPDVYIRHVESCLEKGFIATSPRSSKQKITPKSLQNPVKKAPRISTISFWRSPSKRCEMKKKMGGSDFRGVITQARNPSAYVITQMNSSLRPAFKCLVDSAVDIVILI